MRLRKTIFIALTGVALACVVVLGAALFRYWLFLRAPGGSSLQARRVEIASGMSAASIARLLEHEGVVSDSLMFRLLCSLTGSGGKLHAGEYSFAPLSPPERILDQIASGRVVQYRVTLPEGSTLRDVARAVAEQGLSSEAEILRLATDKAYIKGLGLEAASLEGYLFPETYFFQRSRDAASILQAMVLQFQRSFTQKWESRAVELGMSVHEVVTLASMVEKEAVVDSERSAIAAVFLNRLRVDMPLQSDPTAVYDLQGFSGPVTAAHLKRRSPYNTYQHKGLPAGPICNPGAKSLEAVLYPQSVPYLYFVSNNDGTHHFSKTLQEHNEAVLRYREAKKGQVDQNMPGANPGSDQASGEPEGAEPQER